MTERAFQLRCLICGKADAYRVLVRHIEDDHARREPPTTWVGVWSEVEP